MRRESPWECFLCPRGAEEGGRLLGRGDGKVALGPVFRMDLPLPFQALASRAGWHPGGARTHGMASRLHAHLCHSSRCAGKVSRLTGASKSSLEVTACPQQGGWAGGGGEAGAWGQRPSKPLASSSRAQMCPRGHRPPFPTEHSGRVCCGGGLGEPATKSRHSPQTQRAPRPRTPSPATEAVQGAGEKQW